MDDPWSLLRLQIEWGADEALEAEPLDRLRPVVQAPAPRPAAPLAESLRGMSAEAPRGMSAEAPRGMSAEAPRGMSAEAPRGIFAGSPRGARAEPPRGTPAERALAAAASARTLDELRAAIAAFDGCALRDTASNLVFAEGDPASRTLVIGEPPGRDEDRSGHPFAGAEGQLLDQMLASIGVQRTDLLLTPLIPWRPPGGRIVTRTELTLCLPFLHRLIQLQKPSRILLFGPTAGRALLPANINRKRNVRAWIEIPIPGLGEALPALALPGLAEMLKNLPLRRDAWAGLRLFRRTLDSSQTEM